MAGLPLLLALGVGINWVAWRRAGINVDVLFELDRQSNINVNQYHEMPAFLLCTLAITMWATFAAETPGVSPGYYILLWFSFLAAFLLNPFPVFHYHARWWICRSLIRVTMNGILQVEVSWWIPLPLFSWHVRMLTRQTPAVQRFMARRPAVFAALQPRQHVLWVICGLYASSAGILTSTYLHRL